MKCKFHEERLYIDDIKCSLKNTDFCMWRRKQENEILICIQAREKHASDNLIKLFNANKAHIENIVDEKLYIVTGTKNKDWIRIKFSIYCTEGDYLEVLPKCREKFLLLIKAFNSVSDNMN